MYAISALPADIQAAVLLRYAPVPATSVRSAKAISTDDRVASAWRHYESASDNLKVIAQRRLKALHAIEGLRANGLPLMQARSQVAAQLQREGVRGSSVPSLARWASDVDGAPREAWLALLLPEYVGRTVTAPCDVQVWDWYKGHYLTRARPSHASTYARVAEMAREQGWAVPSARTLNRRMDREVNHATQVLLREGPEAAARLLPPQHRDASVFGAGEAVNGDGLKFDRLWVRFEDGEVLNTATAWFWQDLRTRRVLAWRLAKTENTDLFRLATYDLTAVCAPRDVWVDNTRVAANKLMTAGAAGRHRFKSDPDDGVGLLLMLGMEPHFTNPDKEVGNPGAKPIERAFGIGGIHSEVASHPSFVGRGYSQATAISVAELRDVLTQEVARHNARTGRRTSECRGVLSFDQAWEAALIERPVRVLSDSQRRLLLMSREVVRADSRTGLLALDAGKGPHGRNRYWSEHLTEHAGRKLAVHFDPENLSADVHIYTLDGRYLFAAQHQPTVAFNDTGAAREHAKFKQRRIKAQKAVADAEVRMNAIERASLYSAAT
ncbi:MAG TPA: transposase domain-containing protein, partial [Verrucomicrobiae bacterium]|nr:transposase domain-containing protein [Verrucomicrobiae bacterium]